jgi:gamma-glutamylcyclotransferase (GGCT)/AIG2-like uncharacterized protein YtfP
MFVSVVGKIVPQYSLLSPVSFSLSLPSTVFTYGSLMFPEVWERVVRGRYFFQPAVAQGFQRYCVMQETYPGMIAISGQSVEGVLYFDVDSDDLKALDAFEGSDYVRENVNVRLPDGSVLTAATYLYLPRERLLDKVWLPREFDLDCFLKTCCANRGV